MRIGFSDIFHKKPAAVLVNDFHIAAADALDAENRGSHSFRYIITGTTATGFEPEERVLQVWREVAALHTGSDNSLEVKLRDLTVTRI